MTYRQYTKCVRPEDHHESPFTADAFAAGFVTLIAILSAILGAGPTFAITVGFASMLAITLCLLHFVDWWLYGRLVCLGGDQCAIGMVVSVEPKSSKKGFWRSIDMDTDYCLNLLLPPHHLGDDYSTISTDGMMGNLIKEQDATKSRGMGFREGGYVSKVNDDDPKDTAVLHCECEGAGIDIFKGYLEALLVLSAIGTALSFLCYIPVFGWIACAIAAALLYCSYQCGISSCQ
jgi:hypothetical protein